MAQTRKHRGEDHRLHLLGVRHHGPGSARAVLAALDACDPAAVLIEGPPDADDMIAFAASAAMTPPVALLVHARDDPRRASFFPYAVFSPEWQAMRWALARRRPVRFIDLPMANRLAAPDGDAEATADDAGDGDGSEPAGGSGDGDVAGLRHDPLAWLAAAAGYADGEAWWNAVVEQGGHGEGMFAAIEAAMTALRERHEPQLRLPAAEAVTERRREAHMRLAVAAALAGTAGPVAVVCGAWHVPALRRRVAAAADRALVKGLAAVKVTATWVPWTETRLAAGSGYGAGVVSPGWYAHLWREREPEPVGVAAPGFAADGFAARWQARVAALLRRAGRPVSTAAVIEAVRLSLSLAALRGVAVPGLEEMGEASLATLCEGEAVPFRLIADKLVIGDAVGTIDESVPQMPLAADLARWQRRLKLKPEALDTDIALDLRSDAGLAKSQLLHRLTLIGVPWGTVGAATGRGSFRENWRLRWEAEFPVRLAEALVHGTTIEQAAGNAAVAAAGRTAALAAVAAIVRGCLDAGLQTAAESAIAILQERSAATGDVASLAGAVPPLAEVLRYGTARALPVAALRLLVTSLTEAVCAGLVHACRSLQPEPARELRTTLGRLDVAITLIDATALTDAWRRAVSALADDAQAHALLRGQAVRMLYDRGIVAAAAAALHLSRALSPAVPVATAGDWLDGFLGDSAQILLHDVALRDIVDGWLSAAGDADFTCLLPVLRRAFAHFDRSERRRLLDAVTRAPARTAAALPAGDGDGDAPGFAAALPLLLTILGAGDPVPEETPS